jgi:hypothetical protein
MFKWTNKFTTAFGNLQAIAVNIMATRLMVTLSVIVQLLQVWTTQGMRGEQAMRKEK